MKQEETRRKLIDGTIHVIAQGGLDNATTKQIGMTTGLNEAYIYRCFSGKEDLFAKTFISLDKELLDQILSHMPVLYKEELAWEERCRRYFYGVWDFMIAGREKCLAYIRYFYSPYFAKNSIEEHTRLYQPVLKAFTTAFLPEADIWMILNHMLNVIMDFAIKVHIGQLENKKENSEHVFRVIYRSVEQYFR